MWYSLRPVRLPNLVCLLLLVIAAALFPARPAHAHAGHAAVAAKASAVGPAAAALAVLQSGSHCPSDSGGCCCHADRGAGYKPARVLAAVSGGAAAASRSATPMRLRGAPLSGHVQRGPPITTRLARAPPRLV